jgi:hypothetical protein
MLSVGSALKAKKLRMLVLVHIFTIQYSGKWIFVSILIAWFLFTFKASISDMKQVDVMIIFNLNLT